MTKEEWEKQQSVVRRVYDPDTGRHRLNYDYRTFVPFPNVLLHVKLLVSSVVLLTLT